eukprot:2412388-Rhodomonas_salina.1
MQFESNARPSRRKAVVTSECDDLEQRHTLCGEGAGGDTSSQRVTEADRTAIASSDISLRGYDHADLRLYGYSRGSSDEPFEPTAPSEGTARTGELHREMSGPTGDAEEDQLMVGGTVDGWLQAPAGGEMWDDQAFMEPCVAVAALCSVKIAEEQMWAFAGDDAMHGGSEFAEAERGAKQRCR